jgi:hypothetical protein
VEDVAASRARGLGANGRNGAWEVGKMDPRVATRRPVHQSSMLGPLTADAGIYRVCFAAPATGAPPRRGRVAIHLTDAGAALADVCEAEFPLTSRTGHNMTTPRCRQPAPRRAPASGAKGHLRLPQFRELTPAQSTMILARHNVGRIAFTFHDRVGIEPIHYVYQNGILYGRTSHGSKLDVLAHHPWVAFEVDEVEGLFDWRSVAVQGTFDRAREDGSPANARHGSMPSPCSPLSCRAP